MGRCEISGELSKLRCWPVLSTTAWFGWFFSLLLRGWVVHSTCKLGAGRLLALDGPLRSPEQQTLQNHTYGPRGSVGFQVFSGEAAKHACKYPHRLLGLALPA